MLCSRCQLLFSLHGCRRLGLRALQTSPAFRKDKVLTVPNALSAGRLVASPLTGYLVLQDQYTAALGLFTVVGLTDILDGWIARQFPGQASVLGSVLDPLADKVFMSVLCVSLTCSHLIPVALAGVILGRDVLLIAASFYLRYITLPPPRTVGRYWDITLSTVQVTPSLLGKATAGVQLVCVGLSLVGGVCAVPASLLTGLWWLTGLMTLGSGLSYLVRMKGFRVLNKPP